MHAIDITYASRRDLRDHLLQGDEQLALVVPRSRETLPPGAHVSVRITAQGLAGDAMFEAEAREIRVASGSFMAVVPSRAESRRLAFLRDWACGQESVPHPREERLSVDRIPCVMTLATPAVRREQVKLLDVSARGARVTFSEPLARGSLLILEVQTPQRIESFAASVMWTRDAMIGLQLCMTFAGERAAWTRLVAEMKRQFGESVASSIAPEAPIEEVIELSPEADVEEEPTDEEGPPATGRYRIVDHERLAQRRQRASDRADDEDRITTPMPAAREPSSDDADAGRSHTPIAKVRVRKPSSATGR